MLIARIFPSPCGVRKNTTQLAKYPRVLYVKPSYKMYVLATKKCLIVEMQGQKKMSIAVKVELIVTKDICAKDNDNIDY